MVDFFHFKCDFNRKIVSSQGPLFRAACLYFRIKRMKIRQFSESCNQMEIENQWRDAHSGVRSLLNHLVEKEIPYCHFKSNEHVAEGISGLTDLDLLCAREWHMETVAALVASGFKLFVSGSLTRYSAVEDWIGFDTQSGRLAHLHVHWQMVAGEPYIKGYRLPWEKQILDDRVWDSDNEIHTSSPEMELLLLLVRAALKLHVRNIVLRGEGQFLEGDLRREFDWLLMRVDIPRFERLSSSLLSPSLTSQLMAIVNHPTGNMSLFLRFRKELLTGLAHWRTYPPIYAKCLRWQRELSRRFVRKALQRIGGLSVSRRTPSTGGILIALLGADGSGKSTQAKSLVKWLGWKVDVARVYFGSGDGPMSWHRRVLLAARNVLGRSRAKASASATNLPAATSDRPTASRPVVRGGPGLFKTLYALSLAMEKRGGIRSAVRARNRGMIVVCDRFPQNQIVGYNDGPLLADCLERGFPWGAAARLEQRLLSVFSEVAPDLLFKLNVSESVAGQRKSDTPKAMIQRKIDAVRALEFGPSCEVIELDADRPLGDITLAVRHQVWKRL